MSIPVRMSHDDKATVIDRAAATAMSVSEYGRGAALRAPLHSQVDADAIAHVIGLGRMLKAVLDSTLHDQSATAAILTDLNGAFGRLERAVGQPPPRLHRGRSLPMPTGIPTATITIHATPADKDAIRLRAAFAGFGKAGLSEYCRKAMLGRRIGCAVERNAIADLGRVGGLIKWGLAPMGAAGPPAPFPTLVIPHARALLERVDALIPTLRGGGRR